MTTTAHSTLGTRTSVGTLGTLANNTYLNVGTITFNTNTNMGCKLEVYATPGTVSGSAPQLLIFAQQSLDGTNYETGPVSSTSNTDQQNLTYLGSLPLNSNSTLQRRVIDLAASFGGSLPYSANIIVQNVSGAALASGSVYYSEVQVTSV